MKRPLTLMRIVEIHARLAGRVQRLDDAGLHEHAARVDVARRRAERVRHRMLAVHASAESDEAAQ